MFISNKKLPIASMINLSCLMIFVLSVSYLQGALEQVYPWQQAAIGTLEEEKVISNFNRVQYKQSDNDLADDSALLNLVKDTSCLEQIKKAIQYCISERVEEVETRAKQLNQNINLSLPALEPQTFLNKWWYKKPLKYMSTDVKASYELQAKMPSENSENIEKETELNKMHINGLACRAQLYAQLYNQLDAIKERKANISALHIELLFDVCNSLNADKNNQSETVKKNVEAFLKQEKNWFENRHNVYNEAIISDCDDSDFIDYYIKTYFPLIGNTGNQYTYDCTPTLLFLQRVKKCGYEMAADISDNYPSAHPPCTVIGISVIIKKKNPIFIEMETWLYDNIHLNQKYLTKDSFDTPRVYTMRSEEERIQKGDTKYLLSMNPLTLYPYQDTSEEGKKKQELLKFIDTLNPMCFFDQTYTFAYDSETYENNKIREMIRAKPRHHVVLYKFMVYKIILAHSKEQNGLFCCCNNQGECYKDCTIINSKDMAILKKQCADLDDDIKAIAEEWFQRGALSLKYVDSAMIKNSFWR